MIASKYLLFLVDDQLFELECEIKEDKKIKEEVGGGWINAVLIVILIHKIIAVFGNMAVKFYAIFWKDNVGLSPFWSSMVSFVTIISGAFLNSFITPLGCRF